LNFSVICHGKPALNDKLCEIDATGITRSVNGDIYPKNGVVFIKFCKTIHYVTVKGLWALLVKVWMVLPPDEVMVPPVAFVPPA
jgi:hypothetical protein